MSLFRMNQKYNFSALASISLLLLSISFSMGCQTSKKGKSSQDPFATFDWLIGHWERSNLSRAGQHGFERWEKKADQSLKGVGILLQGTDTLFKEELQILIREDAFYYLALHQDAPKEEWIAFKITEVDQQHFKSENYDYGFPHSISYFLESAGELRTKISSGEIENHFVFRKRE